MGQAAVNRTLCGLTEHYERSEITVLWIHHRPKGADPGSHQLLFAVAEMCPAEQPPSPVISDVMNTNGKQVVKANQTTETRRGVETDRATETEGIATSDRAAVRKITGTDPAADTELIVPMIRRNLDAERTLYVTRVFTDDPMDAVAFYRGGDDGRRLRLPTGDVLFHNVPHLVAEPPEGVPAVISSNLYDTTSFGAVLPRRATSMRVCSWLDATQSVRDQLTDQELRSVSEFAMDTIGIDLAKFAEHLGAIHLCGANPLLRYVRIRLSADESALRVACHERSGRSVVGCTARITDERAHGTGFVLEHELTGPRFSIPLPCPPERLRFQLFDPDGPLLKDWDGHFVRHVGMDMDVVTTRRRVVIHDETRDASETHTVNVVERQQIHIPEDRGVTAPDRIREAERDRARATLETTREFVYFPGDDESRRKALAILRELFASARERCIVCDPYLAARDVVMHTPFVEASGLQVRLIASAFFLRTDVVRGDSDQGNRGSELLDTIEHLKTQDPRLVLDCRVLKGGRVSPIHDRFLVIDNDVYMLGSSLNEFGRRVTTLFRVPNPADVIAELETWWNDGELSVPLDEWVDASRAARDA